MISNVLSAVRIENGTYTGDGVGGRSITHHLGKIPKYVALSAYTDANQFCQRIKGDRYGVCNVTPAISMAGLNADTASVFYIPDSMNVNTKVYYYTVIS